MACVRHDAGVQAEVATAERYLRREAGGYTAAEPPCGSGTGMFEIGSTLQQARERRRIPLERVERETKIRARYIRALEEEDYDALPGPTFVRGFLRTYASYLGLDGELFVEEYKSRFFDPLRDDHAFPRRRALDRRRKPKREQNLIVVVLAAIVSIAVLVALAATYPRDAKAPPTVTPAIVTDTAPSTSGDSAAGSTDPCAGAENLPLCEASHDNEVASAIDEVPTEPVRLMVTATGDCYVTIEASIDGSGKVLIPEQLFKNGQRTQVLESDEGFTVTCKAGGNRLRLRINRKLVKAPSASTFYILRDGSVQTERPG